MRTLRRWTKPLLGEIKAAAASLLRSDVQRSLALGELILLPPSGPASLMHRALGLITVANAYSLGGLGRDAESHPPV